MLRDQLLTFGKLLAVIVAVQFFAQIAERIGDGETNPRAVVTASADVLHQAVHNVAERVERLSPLG